MTSGGNTSSGTYGGRPGSRISGGVVTLGLLGSKNCLKFFLNFYLKTSYSIFRAGSSNKFEIAALLSQPKNIKNAIANQIPSKRWQFQNRLKSLL